MRIKIEVTSEHIARGVRDHCEKCPIALAFSEVIDGRYRVHVEVDLELRVVGMEDRLDFPLKCNRFIELFDAGGEVKPFSFWMSIPAKYLKRRTDVFNKVV